MYKKFLSIITALLLSTVNLVGCAAEEMTNRTIKNIEIVLQIDNPVMTVNGAEKPIDSEGTVPIIVDDRTLLPVRALIEEMGGAVEWDGETQTVTLNFNEDEIRLTIDDTAAYLNNTAQTLDTAPTIINDRTMLPIRFIAESFKFEVAWNDAEQKVIITKAAQLTEPTAEPEQTSAPDLITEPTNESADAPTNNEAEENKMLVVYFSGTGNTEALAQTIAQTTGADIYEIVPEQPYTSEDLNYNNDNCRANREMNDESARPAISGSIENIDDYDTIFLGYPIWWGTMPRIINTFLDTYDLSGKTVMPFCTSGGSGIGTSVSSIRSICADAAVKDGFRGSSSSSASQIESWLENNIDK